MTNRLAHVEACGIICNHFTEVKETRPSPTYDLLESEQLQYKLSQPDIVAFFSSVTVLHLADEQISSRTRHRPLKELIQRQTDEVRHIKQNIGCLFSALYLTWYFGEAVKHSIMWPQVGLRTPSRPISQST